jgi:hypothetical protein
MSAPLESKLLPISFLLVGLLALPAVLDGQDKRPPRFEADILPILKENCLSCHSGDRPQASLDASTLTSLLKGGKSGKVVQPGSPDTSLLLEKLTSGTMPPGDKKLSKAAIDLFREWVERGASLEASPDPKTGPSFPPDQVTESDVLPIFQLRCVLCHGKRRQEGGLDLRTQQSRLKGGKSGPALLPGKPDESLLFKKIASGAMPPPKLLVEYAVRPPASSEVETLRKWIAAGCPPSPQAGGSQAPTEAQVSEEDRKFWSFQPPRRPPIPTVTRPELVRTPVDAFLLAKLEAKGLGFSPAADRLKLMRRAYLDLIGMPPEPAEVARYLADRRPDAYERLIDSLLDSPHYGERWGQFWLNAAGYADSEGIIDQDMVRPHAWRYRDYVIRSFNSDKPFDQFLIEQIAGDELVDYRQVREVTPEVLDKLVATGFLRTAPDATYSPSNSSMAERVDVVADEIEILSSAVLGLTVGCARCHDHKYDPVSQRDYYRFFAILQAAYDPFDWMIPVAVNRYNLSYPSRHIDLAPEAERREAAAFNAPLERELKKLEESLQAAARPYRERALRERLAALPEAVQNDLRAVADTPEERRTELQKYLADKFQDVLKIEADQLIRTFPEFKPEGDKLKASISELKAKLRPKPQIRALFDMGGEPSVTHVLRRGDVRTPGEPVQPGVLSVLRTGLSPYRVVPPQANPDSSGRRLALARWLVQPNHPLTSRVMVNRIWMHHFGRALVATPANFGRAGAKPTHPELLDWLATEFVRGGWSVKAMHRLIMTSAAYRQTSSIDGRAREADPENLLLSRMPMRRADAEVIHDSILRATGRLDATRFGPPAQVDVKPDGVVVAKATKAGYRRSIYVLQRRMTPLTLLDVFDLPSMSPNCIERRQSLVPTQALELTNGETLKELSRFMAGRLIDDLGEDARQQVEQIYLRALSRRPDEAELTVAMAGLSQLAKQWTAHLENQPVEAPTRYTARWRALADLCQTILSSAEFLYVD